MVADFATQSAPNSFIGTISTHVSKAATGRTGVFLRKQLWIWPLVAAGVLGGAGWFIRGAVEHAVKAVMAANLETILEADVTALQLWLKAEQNMAATAAGDPRVRTLAEQLIGIANRGDANTSTISLLESTPLAELRAILKPTLNAHRYDGFLLVDLTGHTVGALRNDPVGTFLSAELKQQLAPVYAGKSLVTRPAPSPFMLPDGDGVIRAGLPNMFVVAPIASEAGQVIAILGFRIRPEREFTRILSVARPGKTGETYAFDRNGLMLSQSRFDNQLKAIGLLPDRPDSHSILNLELRDPGVDLTAGQRTNKPRTEQPLTRMAAAAAAGQNGVEVAGYRDYRGVPTIGAWRWLPEFGMGVATEYDLEEAYQPLYILRTAFWALFALLAATSLAIFVFTVVVAQLQQTVIRAEIEARQLGQYTLDERIGQGGMGVVYKGHHALLRRPTAIKLLDTEKATDSSIARFEREVQLTSQLNHPNTIAVYDYGRTPEGVFFYAMEYLDGLTLEALVGGFGPQPEGRVISLLRQVCGSLNEAHGIGLIHRDIKPANIIVNKRGGMYDVAKVLDFGLVKAIDSVKEKNLTAANAITGTPLYLSPEGIERPATVDARSDLYAIAAVGYFLLTGKPVFDGGSIPEICIQHMLEAPQRPSQRLGKPISVELESVIMKCLAKSPADRIQTAQELSDALANCPAASTWTTQDAEAWWTQNVKFDGGHPDYPTVANVADGCTLLGDSKYAALETQRPVSLQSAGID